MNIFNESNPNAFRYRTWYPLIITFILLTFTMEVLAWLKDYFYNNISQEWQVDGIMLSLIIYWLVCIVIPYWVTTKFIARYGDGVNKR